MKPGIPWSVKGVEPQVREAAKEAARRSGLTLGEWLNTMIIDQAEEKNEAAGEAHPEAGAAAPRDQAIPRDLPAAPRSIRLEDIARQLSALARQDRDTAAIRSYEPSGGRTRESMMLDRIADRLENNERQAVEAFTAMNERLSALGQQVNRVSKQAYPAKAADVPGFQALEQALRNIVDHMEVSEKRTRQSLKEMQDRLGDMGRKVASADAMPIARSAPELERLESRLGELARRIDQSEDHAQSFLPELVRKEMAGLTERIETVRQTSEALASKAQTGAVQAAKRELNDIERRIVDLVKEAQTALSGSGASASELNRLRTELSGINRRIDAVGEQSASARDVTDLRHAVEQLSARVAQGPDMKPLAELDRKLADLARRLDQNQAENRANPQLAELERKLGELDRRVEDALRRKDDHGAVAALERQIGQVNERVDRTEKQLEHLATIERAIGQLFEAVEQNRNWASSAAEEAASRMADKVMAAVAAPHASGELRALEDGLRAVRESAALADSRNQETLEAVHETLEQIVDRLAEMEGSASRPMRQPEPPAAEQAAPAEDRLSWPAVPEEVPADQPLPVYDAAGNPFLPVEEETNPFLEADPVRTHATGFPEAFDEAAQPQEDFISAARRAAQAAAAQNHRMAAATAAKGRMSARGLSSLTKAMPFMRRKPASSKQETEASSGRPMMKPVKPDGTSRRKLLLAGLVLLAAVSAFTVNMIGRPQVQNETSKPAVIEQPAAPGGLQPGATQGLLAPEGQPALARQNAQDAGELDPADDPGLATASIPEKLRPPPGGIDEAVGPESLRLAAVKGDPTAQFIVASRYLEGNGVAKDYAMAASWYRKAADQGLAPAQYRLATLYERGKGLPRDLAAAAIWYERAAEKGNIRAMHNAAVIAAGTQGGSSDYTKALRLFMTAAAYGLKDSQYNLAVLYERGYGTSINSGEAFYWYTLAAKQGDADARKRAWSLGQVLAPSVIESIGKRALLFRPTEADPKANVVAVSDETWRQGFRANAGKAQPSSAAPDRTSDADGIRQAQELLGRLGYDVGLPDGKLGARTASAILQFQRSSGLAATGTVTADLVERLRDAAS